MTEQVAELVRAVEQLLENTTYADGVATGCTLDHEAVERALANIPRA